MRQVTWNAAEWGHSEVSSDSFVRNFILEEICNDASGVTDDLPVPVRNSPVGCIIAQPFAVLLHLNPRTPQ
jgi:hypothetical protein